MKTTNFYIISGYAGDVGATFWKAFTDEEIKEIEAKIDEGDVYDSWETYYEFTEFGGVDCSWDIDFFYVVKKEDLLSLKSEIETALIKGQK